MKTFLSWSFRIIPVATFLAIPLTISLIRPALCFEETFRRYISGHDVFRTLSHVFATGSQGVPAECAQYQEDDQRDFMGEKAVITGQRVSPTITNTFVRWYIDCISQYISSDIREMRSDFSDAYFQEYAHYYGWDLVSYLSLLEPAEIKGFEDSLERFPWIRIPRELQRQVVRQRVYHLIGENVLRAERETRFVDEILRQLGYRSADLTENKTIFDAIREITFAIAMSDEFLTY